MLFRSKRAKPFLREGESERAAAGGRNKGNRPAKKRIGGGRDDAKRQRGGEAEKRRQGESRQSQRGRPTHRTNRKA